MANELYRDRSHRNASVDYVNTRPKTAAAAESDGGAKRAAPSARTTGARSTASSRTSAARSTGTQAKSRAASGTTKRRTSKKKKQQRSLVAAMLFLAFAIIALSVVIIVAMRLSNADCKCTGTPIFATPSPSPSPTPEPVTENTVITGDVTVNNVRVTGQTVAAAKETVLAAMEQQLNTLAVTVAYGGYSMTLTAEKIGMTYSEDELDRVIEQAATERDTAELFVAPAYDETMLKTSLSELNDQIPNHAENAKAEILWKENKIKSSGETYLQPYFSFTEGTNGMAVDSESVLRQVEDALQRGDYTAEIRPQVTISEPAVTVEMLKEQYSLRGSYVTTYRFRGTSSMDESSVLNCESRDANISKAVGLMNVIELKAGKTFSYNTKTGSRTEKNGWALANAIYQGSHRPEAGGGVCQLSTTMYNALLLANVKIVSRRAHSMQVDYVPDGWDATVDDGHIDFKFQNNTGSTLYVFCYITKNAESSRKKDIHVEVYGKAFPEGTEYRQRTELVEILPITEEIIKDKTMFVGDKQIVEREGKEGKIVNTFIDRYVNGVFDKTVYSETTTYEAITKQIRVGTKPDPTPTPSPTPKPTSTPKATAVPDGY